jgi:hypothetical protein
MGMHWKLEIDKTHAAVIMSALDLYSRIHMGQLDELLTARYGTPCLAIDECRDIIEKLKDLLFQEGHGITSRVIDDNARAAWDLQQVIRHRVAWDEAGNPAVRDFGYMMTVDFDNPMRTSTRLPLATIRRIV